MMRLSAPNRKPLLLVGVSCFALALMTLVLGVVSPASSGSSTIVIAYLAIMAFLLVVLVVGKTWIGALAPEAIVWLHPPLLITIWVFLFFGLPELYALLQPDVFVPLETLTIDPLYSARGMWLVIVGCVLLWIGYGIGYRVWKPWLFSQRLAQQRPRLGPVLAIYTVVIVFQLVQIAVVGIAYGADASQWGALAPFQQWVGYIQDADRLVLTLVALKSFRGEWPFWLLIVVVALQTGFGFISGFMKPILWIAVILLLTAIVAGINLRRLAVPAALFAVLGVLVVPVAEDLRFRKDAGLLDTSSATEVAGATTQSLVEVWSTGSSATWQLALDRTLYRNAIVASTPGIIMEKTPSIIPYQGIEQFLAVPAYIIPRALWLDKPVLSRGIWFSVVYLNMPSFTTSSAAITIFGEGYMYAGWIGALLACLILGLLLAGIYRNTANVGLWAVYIALVPTFIDVEGQFTGMFVALIQRTAVFIFVYWLITWLSNPHQAVSRGGEFRARVMSGPGPGSTEKRSF